MKLRLAEKGDLQGLISLWQDVFGDHEDFIRAFYEASGLDRTIVAIEGDAPVGMINCPEVSLWSCSERFRGAYIYALAVDRTYRNRGIASALLTAAESDRYWKQTPKFLLLIPAEPSLFAFYAQKGYDRAAYAPLRGIGAPATEDKTLLSHDCDALYEHYLAACESEAQKGAVFVKEQPIFALSMGGTRCYADRAGYVAFDLEGALAEQRPAKPDLSRKTALWKALDTISTDISPIISRFMED